MVAVIEGLSISLIVGIGLALIILVLAIVATRLYWSVYEYRASVLRIQMSPLLFDILDGNFAWAAASTRRHRAALGERLSKMSREVRGSDRDTIAEWLTLNGYRERAESLMRSHRAWRRARGIGLYLAATRGLDLAPVEGLLADRHPRVRSTAARALGSVAAIESIPALLGALTSADRPVALSVVSMAIVHMAPRSARDLGSAWSSTDVRIRQLAAEVSGHLGLADARTELEAGLMSTDKSLRLSCAGALARIASPASLGALRAAHDRTDDDEERSVLKSALRHVTGDGAETPESGTI